MKYISVWWSSHWGGGGGGLHPRWNNLCNAPVWYPVSGAAYNVDWYPCGLIIRCGKVSVWMTIEHTWYPVWREIWCGWYSILVLRWKNRIVSLSTCMYFFLGHTRPAVRTDYSWCPAGKTRYKCDYTDSWLHWAQYLDGDVDQVVKEARGPATLQQRLKGFLFCFVFWNFLSE